MLIAITFEVADGDYISKGLLQGHTPGKHTAYIDSCNVSCVNFEKQLITAALTRDNVQPYEVNVPKSLITIRSIQMATQPMAMVAA